MNKFVLSFAFGSLIVISADAYSQSHTALYDRYDAQAGSANAVQNGTLYTNLYLIRPENHNFYAKDYIKGSVTYNGQAYYNQNLKYDIAQDILIVQSDHNPAYGVHLSKSHVDAFELDGKSFENLQNLPDKPDFVNGYYERLFSGSFTLYKKHHKQSRQVIRNERTYDELTQNDSYVLLWNGNFYKADAKKQWSTAFESQKQRIEDFYRKERRLEKSNKEKFLKDLAQFVQNYSQTSN